MEGRQLRMGRLPVEVGLSHLTDLIVPLGESISVTGSVRVDSTNPPVLRGLRITLGRTDGIPGGVPPAQVQENGSFRFEGVPRDSFRFGFQGVPAGLYVKAVRSGGQDVLEKGLDLTLADSTGPLEVVLGPGAGEVEGAVKEGEKPAAGGFVTVVPDPMHPNRLYRYRSATVDPSGSFRVSGLAPGEYRVYAWEAQNVAAPADTELPREIIDRGVRVTVRENGREQVELTMIPAESGLVR
jgi:hypothetical protein